eukprot:9418528-Pyramimonas_sp.AAC.1
MGQDFRSGSSLVVLASSWRAVGSVLATQSPGASCVYEIVVHAVLAVVLAVLAAASWARQGVKTGEQAAVVLPGSAPSWMRLWVPTN